MLADLFLPERNEESDGMAGTRQRTSAPNSKNGVRCNLAQARSRGGRSERLLPWHGRVLAKGMWGQLYLDYIYPYVYLAFLPTVIMATKSALSTPTASLKVIFWLFHGSTVARISSISPKLLFGSTFRTNCQNSSSFNTPLRSASTSLNSRRNRDKNLS